MEIPKNKLTEKEQQFLNGLSDYLDTKLLYYGSIQRDDYIPGKSDIDIDIFTDNEESTLAKLQHYLKISKKEFKKMIWKVKLSKVLTSGTKLKYSNSFLKAEFSIYNIKYKDYILKEHKNDFLVPLHCRLMLRLLKFLYYTLNILPGPYYTYLKKKTFSVGRGYEDDQFLVL
jgi:predicted nucleotidyltransferase